VNHTSTTVGTKFTSGAEATVFRYEKWMFTNLMSHEIAFVVRFEVTPSALEDQSPIT
jgi:hypothetical protein